MMRARKYDLWLADSYWTTQKKIFAILFLAAVLVALPLPAEAQSSALNVSSFSQLQSAIAGLTSNTTILLADGTYNLTGTLFLPQNISSGTIKGASGNRDAVIIKGPVMANSTIPFGFWADNVNGVTFQDITIRDFYQHAIILNGGVNNPVSGIYISSISVINSSKTIPLLTA
jgi:hypothetical protein